VKQLRLELTYPVSGDGLQATEARYPAGDKGACHGLGSDVLDGDGVWPAQEVIDCGKAVRAACQRWKWSNEVYVDVKETGCRKCEVAGDFRALAGLASTCLGSAIFLYVCKI
jgi:hypothetical protein